MATQQPNLPNYQLSKGPEMQLAILGQMNQNLTSAMDNLVKNQKAKKAQELALDKEARTVQNQFLSEFGKIDGSLVGQMDKANRIWARETASTLNKLYTKAYGSNGTEADKDAYMDFQSQSMYNIKVIGTNATFVANNQKALSTNQLAKSKKSKNVGLLSDNYLYEEGGQEWYEEGMKFQNGQYTSFRMKTLDNGQVEMVKINKKGEEVNTNLNARYETYTKNGKDLNSYIVGKDDLLSTHSDTRYKSNIKTLLDADVMKTKITEFNANTGHWETSQTISYPSLQELEANNPQLGNQINQDLNSEKMPKFWAQMRQKELVNGGVKGTEAGELPWHFLNSVNDDKLKKMIGPTAKEYAGVVDPTPDDGWKPADLQAVRDGVNAKQDEAATQAWLVEYQKYRPEGQKTQLKQRKERIVGEGAGGAFSRRQKAKWSKQKAADYQTNVLPKIEQLVAGGDLNKVAAELQLKSKKGLLYLTGAELMANYPSSNLGLNGEEIYSFTMDGNNLKTMPKTTSITADDFDEVDLTRNKIAQSLFNEMGYDPDDQYYYTQVGQDEIGNL